MRVLSIDIGVRNLAMWIEEYDVDRLEERKKSLKKISKRVNENNESTEEYKTFLKDFFLECSKTVYADKIDLCENTEFKKTKNNMIILNNQILFNVIKELDKRKDILINVKYIVIEKQLKNNPNAQAVQNHIHAYFLHQYGLSKIVEVFDSCHKTRMLGCPRKINVEGKMQKINKAYRKKWTTNLTRGILFDRKDKKFYQYVFEENKSKADDLSDTFCQASAFVLLQLCI
jgi:hypothetical protein